MQTNDPVMEAPEANFMKLVQGLIEDNDGREHFLKVKLTVILDLNLFLSFWVWGSHRTFQTLVKTLQRSKCPLGAEFTCSNLVSNKMLEKYTLSMAILSHINVSVRWFTSLTECVSSRVWPWFWHSLGNACLWIFYQTGGVTASTRLQAGTEIENNTDD